VAKATSSTSGSGSEARNLGRGSLAAAKPHQAPIWLLLAISLGVACLAAMLPASGYCTRWLTPLRPPDAEACPTPQGLVLSHGGRFEGEECGVVLVFPQGALSSDVLVTCWQEGPGVDAPPGALGEPFNLDVWEAGTSERVTSFGAPVILYATYTDDQVAGIAENDVGIARYDPILEQWDLIRDIFLDADANTITYTFQELTESRYVILDARGLADAIPSSRQTATPTATHTVTLTPTATRTLTVTPTEAVPHSLDLGTATATSTHEPDYRTSSLTRAGSATPTAGEKGPSRTAALANGIGWSDGLRSLGIFLWLVGGSWVVIGRLRHSRGDV
jgi:hypothetical protein